MVQNQPSHQEEYRQSFLRHLANRIDAVEQRIHRFRREGWEMGGMAVLHEDVQRLADSAGRYDLIVPSQRLSLLEEILGDQLALERLPDPQMGDRMLGLLGKVTTALSVLPGYQKLEATAHPAPTPAERHGIETRSPVRAPGAPPEAANATAGSRSEAARAPVFGWMATRHIYQISDANPLATEIGQRLQTDGFELEKVDNADDLKELMMCVSPEMVIVDASRVSELGVVGVLRRDALERSNDKDACIRLVVMAAQDNLQSRLEARRAGADLLMFPPYAAADVVRRMQAQLAPSAEEPVRVLVVEDDHVQALFAKNVLSNAGMQAQVELDAMRVLEALESFNPDLILMDLHMPDADGVELTALIREHPVFMDTPIVFLTGENDPEARSAAINAGGDDYLSKPIRPKALITAVQNRVRRRRAVARRNRDLRRIERDEATGLYRRNYLFDRVNDALGASADQHSQIGGVLFLEIDGAAALRERFGLAAIEHLLAAAGRLVSQHVAEQHVAALFSDNAFVVLATELDDAGLEALAGKLRSDLAQHAFEEGGKLVKLTASVGISPLRHGFDDASGLIHSAERACREARANEQGIRFFEPARAAGHPTEVSLAQQLRDAITGDGFGLNYQPIAAMQGTHEAQYQTLLRMHDSSGRLVPAAEILPLAERAGLMIDIDRWVLIRAMNVLAQQRDMGRAVRLFVPQALTTFAAHEQDLFVNAALASRELSGASLVLECRLADALLNPPALLAFMHGMAGNGVQLCLGQFEYTPEADLLLEQLPLGFIKLAAKYVAADATREARDELRVLSDRAHRFGICVIGHCVEDQHTAATLWLSGIDFIQGNFVQNADETMAFDFNTAVV